MRFGVFGDIHGHLSALEAVLADMEKEGVAHTACLGDIVGRGYGPGECLEAVQALGCPIAQGNHDFWAADLPEYDFYGERNQFSLEQRKFMGSLPLVVCVAGFTIVHASLHHPEDFSYVQSAEQAMHSFRVQSTDVAFNGHTHIPQVFVATGSGRDRQVEMLPLTGTMRLEAGKRYLINPGSVGEPRDGDPRPSYVIYDTFANTVELRRLRHNYR
jgi:predicted phosphodiesterase